MIEYLFVYGSLRTTEGHPMHNYLRGYCELVGDALIGGIKVELGGHSGLMLSGDPDEQVKGELFSFDSSVSADLFLGLDSYMGCGEDGFESQGFFRHRQDVVLLSNHETHEAWVYLYSGI